MAATTVLQDCPHFPDVIIVMKQLWALENCRPIMRGLLIDFMRTYIQEILSNYMLDLLSG